MKIKCKACGTVMAENFDDECRECGANGGGIGKWWSYV